MKLPDQFLLNRLSEDDMIFNDYPHFCLGVMRKYLKRQEWDGCEERMSRYDRLADRMAAMLFRLTEHLEDWRNGRGGEKGREEARMSSVYGMLVLVPVIDDFCRTVKAKEGVVGEHVDKYFSRYLGTFARIWKESVEPVERPYPEFMPAADVFSPYITCFGELTEGLKTQSDAEFNAFAGGIRARLSGMGAVIASCEGLSLLERQYHEAAFARDLPQAAADVKTLRASLADAGYVNAELDALVNLLSDADEKRALADGILEKEAGRVFGRKYTRLPFAPSPEEA